MELHIDTGVALGGSRQIHELASFVSAAQLLLWVYNCYVLWCGLSAQPWEAQAAPWMVSAARAPPRPVTLAMGKR